MQCVKIENWFCQIWNVQENWFLRLCTKERIDSCLYVCHEDIDSHVCCIKLRIDLYLNKTLNI